MSSSLNIKDCSLYKTKAQLKKPIADATHTLYEISFLVLRIRLENGIEGEAYLLSFQYSPNAIQGAFRDILPAIKGFPVNEMGRVTEKLDALSEYFGNQGIKARASCIAEGRVIP